MKLTTGAERITALTMPALCVGLVLAGHQLLYWDGYAPHPVSRPFGQALPESS